MSPLMELAHVRTSFLQQRSGIIGSVTDDFGNFDSLPLFVGHPLTPARQESGFLKIHQEIIADLVRIQKADCASLRMPYKFSQPCPRRTSTIISK